jgi:hypothetical protein
MGVGIQVSDPAGASGSSLAVNLTERYQNAYRVARTACGLGTAAKVVGLFAGGVVFLGGLVGAAGALGQAGFIGGLVLACIIATLFWILGSLVAAVGENLKASLDTAVHTSTFLDNAQRAKIMSLK